MSAFGINNRRKSSHRSKKARPFGKLTLDTRFATQARTFPYESRVQELSFVSFEESKARKNAFSRRDILKRQLEGRLGVHAGPRQGVPVVGSNDAEPARSVAGDIADAESSKSSQSQTGRIRVKGLRPAPLKLSQDVSPSEQAITIGIAIPSSSVSQHTWSPEALPDGQTGTSHKPTGQAKYAQTVATPIIVITPAKDNFSPSDLAPHRPASSVYSRYTNCYSRNGPEGRTPPVPPLPLLTNTDFPQSKWSMSTAPPRESAYTSFEEDLPTARFRETKMSDAGRQPVRSVSKASTAALPTPRRSKGWWNLITSPFSAKSVGSHFWRSPTAQESSDHMPILGDQAEMGVSDPHAGVIFTNRHPDDDALRSAPAEGPEVLFGQVPTTSLKRSDTAPAALDPSTSALNIYRTPSSGEAAAYYDSNRHFPSLYTQSRAIDDDLVGWSPSQSVYMPDRRSELRARTLALMTGEHDEASKETAPSAEAEATDAASMPDPTAHGGVPIGAIVFSSPSEDELKSAGTSPLPPHPQRDATIDSMLSPLSATPEVQDAHIARFVGPHSSYGEQKQVEVSDAPTPSHYGLGVATPRAATISHSESGVREIPPVAEKSSSPPTHVRQDSYGLGISDSDSESTRELFPPPPSLSEKPRLGTDRFGQLTVRGSAKKNDDPSTPKRPWYRRFFWPLATAFGALLMLAIVCLVMFVPQRHADDTPIDARWVNTTGFPPLPAGISTVVQPRVAEQRDTCVQPSGLWNCGGESLPDFRFEIRFRNGTLPINETQSSSNSSGVSKRWQERSALHRFMKERRSPWSDFLYTASPSQPKQAEQEFLGRTTDNITTAPYDGEETPFYMSFLSPVHLSQRRDESSNLSTPNPYPYPSNYASSDAVSTQAPKTIPRPSLPADDQLYPFPSAQPLRLFDRGKDTEHYGFYNYFSKTSYFTNSSSANTTTTTNNSTTDSPSNATSSSTSVCTFAQTRFLVQIWTRRPPVSSLSPLSNASTPSATDTARPGSFPYALTLTLDRHGGRSASKGVYCYALDPATQGVLADSGRWVDEDRAVGGTVVHAAAVPSSTSGGKGAGRRDEAADEDEGEDGGGIDGGSGGCMCKWQHGG